VARVREALDDLAGQMTLAGAPADVIVWLGGREYRAGGGPPRVVTDREDTVLQTFRKYPALSLSELASRSGYDAATALSVLRRLRKKYDGNFADAIHFPGRPRTGGYHVKVVAHKRT
jgi:hypothetical protein